MSLTLIESSPGLQIKRDVNFSNLTLNCDPRLIVPNTAGNQATGIFKHAIAGKMAAAVDICDLDVRNLTVHGKLSSLGINDIELCNIVCDDNFSVTAGGSITETAVDGITLNSSSTAHDIVIDSGRNITSTSTGVFTVNSGGYEMNATTGNVFLKCSTGTSELSTGSGNMMVLSGCTLAIETSGDAMNLTSGTGPMSLTTTGAGPMALTAASGGMNLLVVDEVANINLQVVEGKINLSTGRDGTINLTTLDKDISLTTGRSSSINLLAGGAVIVGSAAGRVGFYGATGTPKQLAPAANSAAIISALQNLGLFI